MKIGILGGTFNPPHRGHFVLAQAAIIALGLDKIFFIPTNRPPHKEKDDLAPAHRLTMLQEATKGHKQFEVLDKEIKRGGTSYTIDTVQELKKEYPDDEFYLIVGSDLANTFSTWKDFDELKELVEIVVAKRNSHPLREHDSFITIDIPQMEVSSSRLRQMIQRGETLEGLLEDRVIAYI